MLYTNIRNTNTNTSAIVYYKFFLLLSSPAIFEFNFKSRSTCCNCPTNLSGRCLPLVATHCCRCGSTSLACPTWSLFITAIDHNPKIILSNEESYKCHRFTQINIILSYRYIIENPYQTWKGSYARRIAKT